MFIEDLLNTLHAMGYDIVSTDGVLSTEGYTWTGWTYLEARSPEGMLMTYYQKGSVHVHHSS